MAWVSIHAPRAGRDNRGLCLVFRIVVSIHAPRAGRDGKRGHNFPLLPHIHGCYPP